MTNLESAAFWSYAHEDDENSGGAIRELARLICNEYSLLQGEELKLFVDTEIEWGEELRQRINNALTATTFFIPIVTPRYFLRQECLRELFEFTSHAQGLGVSELVCPILFVPVDELEESSSDPAKALIARAKYEDWTDLRLRGPVSPEHVRAVHGLAKRLAAVAEAVASRQMAMEAERSEEEFEASIGETVAEIRDLLPAWSEILETDALVADQFLAADQKLEERRRKVRSGPASARFIIAARQVNEYLPLIERRFRLESELLEKTNQLSPLLSRLFKLVREHPEEKATIDEFWSEITTSFESYTRLDRSKTVRVGIWARQHAHETRGMLTLAKACDRHEAIADEVNAQFNEWENQYSALSQAS
jgi:hypothetical protein